MQPAEITADPGPLWHRRKLREQRAATLEAADAGKLAAFGGGRPEPAKLPTVAWFNEFTENVIQSAS